MGMIELTRARERGGEGVHGGFSLQRSKAVTSAQRFSGEGEGFLYVRGASTVARVSLGLDGRRWLHWPGYWSLDFGGRVLQ
ncbi:uncharacterized protein M6B38_402380 [Iris pallida]|uniref:Uncharacterized protein n=1 Tax=Iris pallida TaxID=29817 RepID=A0AAX6FTF7_IRIPA|nr:uncharacterized protein M6B38_402380 [Iris pallida]